MFGGIKLADWVSPKEAARRLGLTVNTIRSWYRKGWIPPNQVKYMPNGYVLVDFTALLTPRPRKHPKHTKRVYRRPGVVTYVQGGRKRANIRPDATTGPNTGGGVAGGASELSDL